MSHLLLAGADFGLQPSGSPCQLNQLEVSRCTEWERVSQRAVMARAEAAPGPYGPYAMREGSVVGVPGTVTGRGWVEMQGRAHWQ
jgi:hypothetical protein